MPLLEIINLKAGYRETEVLHGVSLSLSSHERLVIMGPSGSGKSTLLRAIPRLVEPWSGSILFDGIDVMKLNGEELRRVRALMGYLPQQYVLFPHMKVLDNIVLPLLIVKKMPREKAVDEAVRHLRMLGIEDLADRYPAQLSGGQQQRAALARALAMNPKLLLLDEPTSALDPESRADVLEALYKVSKLGKAMIIVTHEVDFALEAADKIIFMENGRIITEGKPSEVIEKNPRINSFIRKLLARYNSTTT